MPSQLVLASTSPFRRMLMENAGLEFASDRPLVDERQIEIDIAGRSLDPAALALELAKCKALDVSGRRPGPLVLGCDQTMALGSRLFHKPADLQAARGQLLALSGKRHRLNSAMVLARDGEVVWEFVGYADLTMRELTADFVDRYLANVGQKALTSVGGYQLEGEGIQLFSAVEGDYFTILGLPLISLLEQLRVMGEIDG
ncbi:MAG: Maf-like protein [Allorhizobium sp.]